MLIKYIIKQAAVFLITVLIIVLITIFAVSLMPVNAVYADTKTVYIDTKHDAKRDVRHDARQILPVFGNGNIEIIVYADYLCPPCQGIAPLLYPELIRLYKEKKAKIIFVDVPTHGKTSMAYIRNFLSFFPFLDFDDVMKLRSQLYSYARDNSMDEKQIESILKTYYRYKNTDHIDGVFSFWTRKISEDNITSTPTVVIKTGKITKKLTGADALGVIKNL